MPRTKKKTEEVLVKDLFKEIEVPSPKRIEPYLMQQTIFELLKGGQP